VEITAQGKILAGSSYRYFEIYCSLALIYWVLTIFVERLFAYIEKKMSVPEQVAVLKGGAEHERNSNSWTK
jgi:polar amino acid transport system permease protein